MKPETLLKMVPQVGKKQLFLLHQIKSNQAGDQDGDIKLPGDGLEDGKISGSALAIMSLPSKPTNRTQTLPAVSN